MAREILRTFFWEKGLVDLSRLSWEEIYRRLEGKDSEVKKLSLLRQLAENFWDGRYKNGEKAEVEKFLCGFLDGQAQTNMAMILGCGYMDETVRRKAIREIILIVYAFLSRCKKLDGATQGLIDAVKNRPPDENFFKDVEFAVRVSRL